MNTNNPVEACYPSDFFLVIFQCHQSVHPYVLNCSHTIKHFVRKPLLAYLIPEMFHRIALWAISGQPNQPHVLRDFHYVYSFYQDDYEIFSILLSYASVAYLALHVDRVAHHFTEAFGHSKPNPAPRYLLCNQTRCCISVLV